MTRTEEYQQLLTELQQTPAELSYTVQRAQARLRKRKQVRRFLGVPLSSAAAFLVCFILLVNLVPTFAIACSRVPFLRELVRAVAWSPSLSAAVEHDYAQLIGQEQTANGVTARVEYVIVDQKQLVIFYSLDSEQYTHMEILPKIQSLSGEALEGYSLVYGDYGVPNGELNYLTADFTSRDVPEELRLIMQVVDYSEERGEQEAPEASDPLEEPEQWDPECVAEFTFDLAFDPYFTEQGERAEVNETFQMNGQTLTLEDAEIYPTHIRLNFADDPGNSAYLKDLDFYLTNEAGKRFEPISNGITSTGSVDSPMTRSFRVESSFFANSEHLTLHITGATYLDKDRQRVALDLAACEAEYLPEGVEFIRSERKENGWILTFRAQKRGKAFYNLWSSVYYGTDGTKYEMRSWGTGIDPEGGEDTFAVEIPLTDYTEDRVYLEPLYTRWETLSQPVSIPIR